MAAVDPRVAAGLRAQLERWRSTLAGGARRVGWKIGLNDPAVQVRLELSAPVIGHLTSATRLEPGASYDAADAVELRAEAEVAVRLARDVPPDADAPAAGAAIGGASAAIELVDLGGAMPHLERLVAENVFHRAFVVGDATVGVDALGAVALAVDGRPCGSAPPPGELVDTVLLVARLLGVAGERLRAGDLIIAGALAQTAVRRGQQVAVEIAGLERVTVKVGS